METQVKFVVVGHHDRFASAVLLASDLGAHLLLDEGEHGANWNHRRALEWATNQSCRVVVLEDDAMPVAGFRDKIACVAFSISRCTVFILSRHWPSTTVSTGDRIKANSS